MDEPLKDFSRPRTRVRFAVDGDVFDAPPVIPAQVLMEFASRSKAAADAGSLDQRLAVVLDTLETILMPESYALLSARIRDKDRPVGLEQLNDILEWLLEQYGLRPTRPSGDSSDGSPNPESGTPSTESTPVAASISSPSLPIAS